MSMLLGLAVFKLPADRPRGTGERGQPHQRRHDTSAVPLRPGEGGSQAIILPGSEVFRGREIRDLPPPASSLRSPLSPALSQPAPLWRWCGWLGGGKRQGNAFCVRAHGSQETCFSVHLASHQKRGKFGHFALPNLGKTGVCRISGPLQLFQTEGIRH